MKTVEFTSVVRQSKNGVFTEFRGTMDLEDSIANDMIKQGYGKEVVKKQAEVAKEEPKVEHS